tara:strand:- start:224 stop:700 length:477 start_codon:yes stop_codon:yes gene_type:complete
LVKFFDPFRTLIDYLPNTPPAELGHQIPGVNNSQIIHLKLHVMVTIKSYEQRVNAAGEPFYALILQGGVELVKSTETGQFYATSKKTSITSTYDEQTCKALIGQELPGSIKQQQVDAYEYVDKNTGEILNLTHRWVYVAEGETVEENIFTGNVIGAEA